MTKHFAMAVPVLPGKSEQSKKFINDLKGTYKEDFNQSRKKLGIVERTFLQTTPQGEFIIVTLEGENPQAAFEQFGQGNDQFTKWFISQVKEIHGVDLSQKPEGKLPELVLESDPIQKTENVSVK